MILMQNKNKEQQKEAIDKLHENIIKLSKELDRLNFLMSELKYLTKGSDSDENKTKFNTISASIINIVDADPS